MATGFKNMCWTEEDDEQAWESDKFTAMDELAYQSGIDTNIPDKGPNYDKMFMENVEKNQFLSSRDGRMAKTEVIAEYMTYDELKAGRMDVEKMNKISAQGRYMGHADGEKTHGKFLSNLDDDQRAALDRRAQSDDDDDDLFRDDDDDFQRQLEQIKMQRLRELKMQAAANGESVSSLTGKPISEGLHSHDSNDIDGLLNGGGNKKTIPVQNGVKEIFPEEFEQEVKLASKSGTVFMLVYKANNRASDILLGCVNQLQKRLRSVKICVILYTSALLHVPEQHCPILMCYQKGEVVAHFAKLDHFRGSATTALDVEWKLAQAGIIETSLQEDPRESAMFD